MPDVSKLLESEYVTVEFMQNSPSKKGVILDTGSIEQDNFGNLKLSLIIEIDGSKKKYKPNRTSLVNMTKALGNNSDTWTGKVLVFEVAKLNGKDLVIGSVQIQQ